MTKIDRALLRCKQKGTHFFVIGFKLTKKNGSENRKMNESHFSILQ